MPSRLQGETLYSTGGSSGGGGRSGARPASVRSRCVDHVDHNDQYYMDRMREILNGFPNTGPPTYPVQILDHLYMGNQRNADNVELLRRHGITHVLNCAGLRRFDFSRSPYPKDSGIKGFLMISAEDTEDFDIARHFDEGIAFLDRVKKAKGKALVHCNLGVNRSGAVVAAYLMVEQKRTLLEVINHLKVKRFVVLSNKGFRRQLIQFARTRGLLDPIIRYADADDELDQHRRHVMHVRDGAKVKDDWMELRRRETGSQDRRNDELGRVKDSWVTNRERKMADDADGVTGRGVEIGYRDEGRGVTNAAAAAVATAAAVVAAPGLRWDASRDSALGSRSVGDPQSDASPRSRDSKRDDLRTSERAPPLQNSKKSTSFESSSDTNVRERLWTLPRYMGRMGNSRQDRLPSPAVATASANVEVIVSEHGEDAASSPAPPAPAPAAATDDAKSRSKTPLRQLEPVYETKSCDAGVGTGTGSSGTSTGSSGTPTGSSVRLSAAETMSAKLSGLFNFLGPKKPLRSTSYSNVSTSQTPSSSSTSCTSSPSSTEEQSSTTSGALQTSASGSSLSTARPLRIYTRSSTDTEIYRPRQNSASTIAGRRFDATRPVHFKS